MTNYNPNNKENSHKNILLLKIIILSAWLAAMVMIAWFSSQPADASTVQSHNVDTVICKIIIKDFHTFTMAVKEYYIEMVDKAVRKSAHFAEYALLGVLTWLTFNIAASSFISKNKLLKQLCIFLIPVIWCFIYSCSDEIHQYFVEGRYASFTDVIIDTAGAAFGIAFLLLVRLVINKIRPILKKSS